MKILYLTNIARRLGMMQQGLEKLQQEGKLDNGSHCYWIDSNTVWDNEWEQRFKQAELVLIRWMGTGLDTPFLSKTIASLKLWKTPYFCKADTASEEIQKLTAEQLSTIKGYALYGGEINYYNLWLYLANICGGNFTEIHKPDPIHWCGIFHPRAQKVYTDLDSYVKDFCKPGLPNIGILFYRDEWVWNDVNYPSALIDAIERQGMNAVCVFSNGIPDTSMGMPSMPEVFQRFFKKAGLSYIDCLINTQKFSLTGSAALTVDFLKEMDIPVLAAYTIMTEYDVWKDSLEGMNAMEVSISLSLPEFDSVVHGVPVAFKRILPNGDVRYLPIMDRVERMIAKAKKWALLRKKENAKKKIAIIFHNYPPKNSNIGSAVGLDTIESVRILLENLQERGYKLDYIPTDGKEFIRQLTANATNDKELLTDRQIDEANKLSSEEYKKKFATFTDYNQKQLSEHWGEAPGSVMEYEGKLIIPGTMNGNVFITVQPARGYGEAPEMLYHDPLVPPTHHYLGFYHWLREVWQADAVAHIGTHGNLEWLPGKNAGLACSCYPDMSIGDLPNIYPYHMTITGEGLQAKRRGAARLIEHLPAPQTQAGVYDELEELDKAIDEYVHFVANQPENVDKLKEILLEKVTKADLQEEVPYAETDSFDVYVGKLHNYISDLKQMEVHNGLHILGRVPEKKILLDYLWVITRLDNGEITSLQEVIANCHGVAYEDLLKDSNKLYEPLGVTYGKLIDIILERSYELLGILEEHAFQEEGIDAVLKLEWLKNANEEELLKLQQSCQFINTELYPKLLLTTQEQDNILRSFEGRYVAPGPSGSPGAGGADLLPTGRNFFGLDPRTLPTEAAYIIGKQLGDDAINRFIEEEGHYPESVGIVMWSGSNMRSHGQCVAEYLYLMGLKPKYQSGSRRVTGLEVIPLEELQRPRIDVTARISGMFRDSMPALINLMDKAVLMVAALDEPEDMNFVKKHVGMDAQELEASGLDKKEAWRQAAYRVFGDALGTYGAGVAALLDNKNWETVDDIAEVYVRWGGHAYGGRTQGKFMPHLFRKRMQQVEIAIKNEDNHDTNMLSSDDYNAYHGGMIATVKSIRGKAPKGYAGDSTDRSRIQLHSVQEQAKRIFRSESINPKFIQGMMEHGYKGAADLANMVAHSFQWDATSEVMEDWMYEKYAEKYMLDSKMQEWFREINPWALQRMTEIMLEAAQRQMWKAKPETLAELQELYLSMEGEIEELNDD
ncbi:MAG: cobaltochelatase subunit CobN [Phascolarctobacterium sp.]|nr:cobaltochelatase subunit CobN [Phascolarctobacterium sp.]